MAKHKIRKYGIGYRCLSCLDPETYFTPEGLFHHLGKPDGNDSKIPLDGIKKEELWMKNHNDIVKKLTNLKTGEEVDIDV